MDDIIEEADVISRLFLKGNLALSSDEQLAFFMNRFNLDRETVEDMPAFQEHCKLLFNKDIEK